MTNVTFYWLPNCSTCKKALGWLERRGIKIKHFRDIKEEPLTRTEIEELSAILGGPAELFSKRAVKYREMKLNEREVSHGEMLELMADEYTFLKRPIIRIGSNAEAGFFERSWERFLDRSYFTAETQRPSE